MINIILCSPEPIRPEIHDQLRAAVGATLITDGQVAGRSDGLHQQRLRCPAEVSWTDARVAARSLRSDTLAVAALPGSLAAPGPGLIVSDVDSTLITEEVIELLADHAGSRAEVAAVTERAMRGELDFADSLRARVATLAGVPDTVFADVADRVRLSPGASALTQRAHRAGWAVALVSGGFHEVVDRLAGGLAIDRVRANRLETERGRLTGRVLGPIIDASAKAVALTEFAAELGIETNRTVAVGDGANDLAMLDAAALGIAYRAKPVLRHHADAVIGFPRLDAVAALAGL